MKQLVILAVAWLTAIAAAAQQAPEYRLELGAGAGLAAYEGDFNDSPLRGMKPMGGAVVKYKPNPRMSWALLVGYAQLKGSSASEKTWYPGIADSPLSFSSSVVDVSLRYEYNFWPFGTGREYYGAQPFTPFIAIGLGLSFSNAETTQGGVPQKTSGTGGQLPVGVGVKYKLADRLNLAAEWTMHFTGNDKIDGTTDPYGIKSQGLFKNTDCYSVVALTLTYDLWEKCKTCHKE